MVCNNGTYTVSDSTITLNIALDHECSQITVRGIDVAGNWTLSCNVLQAIMGGSFKNSNNVDVSVGGYNDPLTGFANADGVSFYAYYPLREFAFSSEVNDYAVFISDWVNLSILDSGERVSCY